MDKVDNLRKQIDILDVELMKLLNKRYDMSKKIGEIKLNSKKEILDQSREDHVLDKIRRYSHSNQIESVYKTIMNESKKIQKR